MKHSFTLPLLAGALFLAGCDYVKEPLGAVDTPSTGGGDGTVTKRVLLEEFTAWHCIYCPEGHVISEQLKGLYGDDLVIVGIHAGDLADPGYYPTNTDFRTVAGSTYYDNWSVVGIPKGMINRTAYEGIVPMDRTNWAAATDALVGQPAKADIWFSQLDFNSATKTVNATLKISVAQDLGTDIYKMVVYLVEDHVVDWQFSSLANPNDVSNYVHRHVLRDNLNGTWGQDVLTSANVVGDTVTVALPQYTFNEDVGEDFVGTECSLVAYIYNATNDEVEQVVEKKLVP